MLINQDMMPDQDDWIKEIYQQLKANFDPALEKCFPCNFARKAFSQNMIKFLPITYNNKDNSYDYQTLLQGLTKYLEDVKNWDGKFNTSFPLLVILEPHKEVHNLKYCEKEFFNIINYLVNNDPMPWPEHTPSDPKNKFWSMCFNQTQIFINVSHPNHIFRKSRRLCETIVLVINPRERFDKFAGSTPEGLMIRNTIRQNINAYDKINYSPLLGHYLAGELEWPQYMLPITNDQAPLDCIIDFSNK